MSKFVNEFLLTFGKIWCIIMTQIIKTRKIMIYYIILFFSINYLVRKIISKIISKLILNK